MTVQESADALRPDRTVRVVVDYDDYLDEPRCPLCATVLDDVGTPTVDAGSLEVATDLPAYGWRCTCRRSGVDVIARIEQAPDDYHPVEATIDGLDVTIGAPVPAAEVSADV